MYIERQLADVIRKMSQHFRVILLTGPRQVGKTTLLQNLQAQSRSYVTLDDMNQRTLAQQDPATFVDRLQLPVLIDEVQYAPEIFSYIKMRVDREKTPGLFWLTGSQQFDMMKNVSDSLAGRVAVLRLAGISLAEETQRKADTVFIPNRETIMSRQKNCQSLTLAELYHKIWRGSYPDVVASDGEYWQTYYESYLTTYIQRDVRDYLNITDHTAFYKFMQIAAARSGQLINYKDMADDVGVSTPTIKSWLSVLQAYGIIYLLAPFATNVSKRLIKMPKLYFMDTGLCCFLTGWLNADVLERGAMSGAMLETFVVSEIIKSHINHGMMPRIYFYRDKDKREIDLMLEHDGVLYPIEIKKTASVKNIKLKNFQVLPALSKKLGSGIVLCLVKQAVAITAEIEAVPISYI